VSHPAENRTFVALDAGVRETGWAVFNGGNVEATGIIAIPSRQRIDAAVRVSHLIDSLDALVGQWDPDSVACCQPTGIGWKVPALQILDAALTQWSERNRLCVYAYTTQEIRASVAGHPNASTGDLGHAVMMRFGMIGQSKTTREWEAIAVGDYHLTRGPAGSNSVPENSGDI